MSKEVKKAKGGQMKKMSEALCLQTQEEMDRRKQKAVELFLKDKLQEDQRSTEQSLWRLDEGWRTLFRFCKTQEQRNNIEVFKKTWERQLDRIDSCIKDMSDELRKKERLSAQMHRSHLLHMSRLKELQKKRIDILQQEWERSIDKIRKCYNFQRVRMSSEDLPQSLTLEDTEPSDQDKYEDLLRETESLLNEVYLQEKEMKLAKEHRAQLKKHQQILEQGEHKLKDLTSKNQLSREALVRAAKELQNEKGERVLRMHKLCKKMEDKLLMTEKIHKVLVENLNTDDTVEQAQTCEFPELRLLTHQHNVAIELCNALREQRNVLRRQNKQLRRQNEDKRQHVLI